MKSGKNNQPNYQTSQTEPANNSSESKCDFDLRVETVLNWLVTGESEFDIKQNAKEWQDIEEVFESVRQKMTEKAAIDPETVKGWALFAIQDMYKKLLEAGDYVNALKAIKEYHILANKPSKGGLLD